MRMQKDAVSSIWQTWNRGSLMVKKDEYRFTLRFDEDDDKQKKAALLLGQLGRKKARYVAEAVCFYEGFKDAGEEYSPFPAAGGQIHVRHVDGRETLPKGRTTDVAEKEQKKVMENLDAADIAAMKSGMNAFRRKKG